MSWNAEERTRVPDAGGPEAWGDGVVGLFLRMVRLPMTLFAYAAEMAACTAREIERMTGEGVEKALDRVAQPAPWGSRQAAGPAAGAPVTVNPGAPEADADIRREETRAMPDTNLADDMVKLVRYTIVSIKRDDEKILKRDEEIFDDNMTDDAFASWVISKYGDSQGLSSNDRKYLRVSYEVLGRWARQDRKYEKRQLEVLEGIRQELAKP